MLHFCKFLAPKGLRLAKNAGKQNTSWKLLYKNALEYHTWILAPSHHKVCGLTGIETRISVGEIRGVDGLGA